jgi:uncharacterized membrane protein YccC
MNNANRVLDSLIGLALATTFSCFAFALWMLYEGSR